MNPCGLAVAYRSASRTLVYLTRECFHFLSNIKELSVYE